MIAIAPGLWHWTTVHEVHGIRIGTHYLEADRVIIDPRVPEEGLEWLDRHGPPAAALLTNRHHYRHAGRLAEAFGTRVLAPRAGMHEFTHGEPVEPYEPGDVLPGGVVAHEVGAICPDEMALHLPAHRALALADGLVRFPDDGPLGFVPDWLLGDDPEGVRRGLVSAYARLLDLDVAHLLLAHGDPVVGDGGARLAAFVAAHGGAPG